MPCERIGNAIVCSNKIVLHNGFNIELTRTGCAEMLNDNGEIIDNPPKAFWDAVEDYERKEDK